MKSGLRGHPGVSLVMMRPSAGAAMVVLLTIMSAIATRAIVVPALAAPPPDETIAIFDDAPIEWDADAAEIVSDEGYRVLRSGQLLEATIRLPRAPSDQRDARRLIATLMVEPVIREENGKMLAADPWTRLGCVSVAIPGQPSAARDTTAPAANRADPGQPMAPAIDKPKLAPSTRSEVELMRFITGFGGPATFQQDITPLAPLLSGQATLRVFISTYAKPAWKVTLTLRYTSDGVGYRRPVWVAPVFNAEVVTAAQSLLRATVDVPSGLARPRLRIISTGHATDGEGGDEFISRTHVLRIDGIEIARWRPWAEEGGSLRSRNPTAGRPVLDGRALWSSDLDRSGWHPGTAVQPLLLPAPELAPGRHVIELEIENIRPQDQSGRGYWRTSAVAVADEPWPEGSGGDD